MNKLIVVTTFLLALIILTLSCGSQKANKKANSNEQDYLLDTGDTISVQVYGEEDLSIKNILITSRGPVLVDFELPLNNEGRTRMKVGSQATVVVYTGTHPVFNVLARLVMRLKSWLEYAY